MTCKAVVRADLCFICTLHGQLGVFLAAEITHEIARVLQLLTQKIEFSRDIISETVKDM